MVTEITCVNYIEDGILWKTTATQVQGVSLPKCHLKITNVQSSFFLSFYYTLNRRKRRGETSKHKGLFLQNGLLAILYLKTKFRILSQIIAKCTRRCRPHPNPPSAPAPSAPRGDGTLRRSCARA